MTTVDSKNLSGREIAGHLALEVLHEIKNPLDALGNLAYLTSQEAESPERVREYARLAQEQVATLSRIVNQPLNCAKTSAHKERVDMVALAEGAIRIHQRTIESKNIRLVKNVPKDLFAEMNYGEILQVLSNLIVNALDALPNQGKLHLRIQQRKEKVHIVIGDNGCGIPAEHRDGVFEPYFTTKEERGTGLGLSICKKIVDKHGGSIGMRSSTRTNRTGTVFKVCIPI